MAKSSKTRVLDRTDREILRRLQVDGRVSNVDLAKAVNLSPTPCLERVRRLESDGYIDGYMALLNPEKFDAGVVSFVQVLLNRTTEDVFERFKREVLRFPEIVECHMVAGGFDYLLKVRTRDMTDYREFLGSKLASIPGISQTHTYVVMEEVKTGQSLVIDEPGADEAPGSRNRASQSMSSTSSKSRKVAELKAEHMETGQKVVGPAELKGPPPEKATLPQFLRGRRRKFGP